MIVLSKPDIIETYLRTEELAVYLNRTQLHEGGHGHEHAQGRDLTPEQTLALLSYMLEHNRSHAEELHDLGHALAGQGRAEAAELVHGAVHYFEHGNEKLAEALELIKGE